MIAVLDDVHFAAASWEAARESAAGRLRDSVDLESIQNELAATVHQAFEPQHILVWLASAER